MTAKNAIDSKRAIGHLMDLLGVEGLSGREGDVARMVREKLVDAGCKASWIRHDRAHHRIPRTVGEYEIGNLIVKLPGTIRGPRLMFSGHMDTVPLCRGARPVRRKNRIVSKTNTALGADNRTAVATLVTLAETLLRTKAPRPPITLLFTIGEEVGLWGARFVSLADLGRPKLGFNIDGGSPAELVVAAVGADRWEVHVHGISSHAGVHPDHGVSAALIASRAVADVASQGFFGKVVKGSKRGTSNVGTISGGEATNQVTDYVLVKGESRSHDPRFTRRITETYRRAFEKAAKSVRNHKGRTGKVRFVARLDYSPFNLPKSSPAVLRAAAAAKSIGLEPEPLIAEGGVDANYLNAKGLPTVTFGAGQHSPHTVDEYADLGEYIDACRLAYTLATTTTAR